MKFYEITVNGETYSVKVKEVDELPEANTNTASEKMVASQENVSSGGPAVESPMAGTILSVEVQPGQSVVKGETLFILEAMKMENEIVAPQDGTINDVLVNQGDSVQNGQELAVY